MRRDLSRCARRCPNLRGQADRLLSAMDFGIFYDDRPQTACNNNASLAGNPPTGQMYGGFYVDQGPADYHNSALYSDPRIAIYIGMGMHQMPGDVWWRSWRTPPPRAVRDRPRRLDAGPVAGPGLLAASTPTRSRASSSTSGRVTTTYPGTSLSVRADVRRRDVRRADGQPRRARDDVGHSQLRPRRRALGPGPAAVRDRGSALPGVGTVAVEHAPTTPAATAASASRARRSRTGQGAGAVHHVRHRGHGVAARVGDRPAGAAPAGLREHRTPAQLATRASTAPTAASTTRSTR